MLVKKLATIVGVMVLCVVLVTQWHNSHNHGPFTIHMYELTEPLKEIYDRKDKIKMYTYTEVNKTKTFHC